CVDSALTSTSTLSLHDALPIFRVPREGEARRAGVFVVKPQPFGCQCLCLAHTGHLGRDFELLIVLAVLFVVVRIGDALCHHTSGDRKSTRLNSSHVSISYAVFC